MENEIDTLEQNDTWILNHCPLGSKPLVTNGYIALSTK